MEEKLKTLKTEVPFDFKKHFAEFNQILQNQKERLNKFNEEYAAKTQNHQDSVLFGYIQEISENWNNLKKVAEQINLFLNGAFNREELADLNKFLSTNAVLKEINECLTNLLNTKSKLEEEKLTESIEEIVSLKSQFISRLEKEVENMRNLFGDFVNKKIEDFEKSMETGFDNQIKMLNKKFTEDFTQTYDATFEKLNHLSEATQDKITILKKNVKINYIFYSINGLLIFLLAFSSYFLFNAYRDYQNKSKALVNIATKLESQISINAQGQVTLSLAKLKTIFKEDKNSIYLTIKEE
ncbi:hypothetical protein [Campylobacter upsaliensis]|uniref:hypothetical protein n=1 Tax=Campylobacter upsaliensis TaxID=28080 RepID=UPI00214A4119|nr:hypothetical protein [Campylobacter upsaliensis]MCR2100868.1 hypothetical protein [Campylobacter upsaliensis]